jgi:hypothetical protein
MLLLSQLTASVQVFITEETFAEFPKEYLDLPEAKEYIKVRVACLLLCSTFLLMLPCTAGKSQVPPGARHCLHVPVQRAERCQLRVETGGIQAAQFELVWLLL